MNACYEFAFISLYNCFDKGCPTEKHQSVRDNTERHDGLWLFTVASSSSRVFSAMEGGTMNTCLCVKRNKMDSGLLTCLLKFIEYFPDYLSALSRTLVRFFWTTFAETAVFVMQRLLFLFLLTLPPHFYRSFSLTWPAAMQIYWNKRKFLHKKRV